MAIPHPDPLSGTTFSAVELWPDDSHVVMLEQRKLPVAEEYVRLRTHAEVAAAIRDMVVRGAPAIGISAAYAMVLAAREGPSGAIEGLAGAAGLLKAARPTAVNLAWAVDRMLNTAREAGSATKNSLVELLAEEARCIHREDVAANVTMGRLGAERVPDGATILTHCNAGALATGGYGTALGVIRGARDMGKVVKVLADETRPYLQGARLTAWELSRDGIDVTVITDNAAASFFAAGAIDLAVVGSDRIAANGDVANKIGTYGVATLCRAHDRPFYVAAPWSTVDEDCPSGGRIPIEQRAPGEITHVGATQLVPDGVRVENPSFDVTPAHLVEAIFTERGVIHPVGPEALRRLSPRRTV
jgi:methylthioribose-1-phosphate isomerase